MKRRGVLGFIGATAASAFLPLPTKAAAAPVETVQLPIGIVMPWAGPKIPDDYLICNGMSLDRDAYKELFNVLGDAYGPTHNNRFHIPDFRGFAALPTENCVIDTVTTFINYIIKAK